MMYASDHMEIASFAQLLQDSEKTDEIVMENEYQEAGLLTAEELDKKIAEQKQAEKEAEEEALQEKKESGRKGAARIRGSAEKRSRAYCGRAGGGTKKSRRGSSCGTASGSRQRTVGIDYFL